MLRVAGLRAELEQQLARCSGARRSCAGRDETWSPARTPSGNGWNATSTTARSRRSSRCWSICGWPRPCSAGHPNGRARLLADQAAAARATIDTLTALSRGLYPRLLTDPGRSPR